MPCSLVPPATPVEGVLPPTQDKSVCVLSLEVAVATAPGADPRLYELYTH